MYSTIGKLAGFALLVLLFVLSPLQAQSPASEKAYIIETVEYTIEGKTWEYILAKKINFEIGKTFSTKQDLEEYLQDKKQLLINQRVLSEVRLEYASTPRTDGMEGVQVKVYTRDTWNLIILPYFKYDSNTGLLLSLRTRDFNFLGSMETLKLDLDYTITTTKKNEFGQSLEFKLPFRLFKRDFNVGLEESLTYNASDESFDFTSIVTLAMDIDFLSRLWTISLSQGSFYEGRDFYGDRYYYQTKVSLGTEFETPFTIGRWNHIIYAPEVFISAKYRPDRELSEERRGYGPGFYHELKVERIDWVGNFRDGGNVSLGNDLFYNYGKDAWERKVTWEATGHKALGWLGLSGRLSGFYHFDKEMGINPDDNVGAPIRGILDDRLQGNLVLYVNTDLLIKMWTWFLDPYLEVQMGPFFDYALTKRKEQALDWSKDNWYGGGIEVIVFPRFARSLYIRGSIGWDLEAVWEDKKLTGTSPKDGYKRYEIFIGLGHHY
ncbi:MAG: hypothetical protein SNJ78_12335 [Spirochaetales bacterium]